MDTTFKITQGDDATFQISVFQDGEVVSIAGALIWFYIKQSASLPDDEAIIACSTANDRIVPIDAPNGVAIAIVLEADTQSVPPGRYHWAAKVKLSGGTIQTVSSGPFIIRQAPIQAD